MSQWGRYIKVNPAIVREGAGAAEEIADTLRKQSDLASDDSRSASSVHGGLETSGALDGCLTAWEDNWRRLVGSVSGAGERLTACADNYEGSDERGALGFDALAARLRHDG